MQRLFTVPEPDTGGDFKSFINSNSLEVANANANPHLRMPGWKNAINLSVSAISHAIEIRQRKSKCGTALSL
ncbi:MAG: hypothetical protein DME59_02110 [Verrucomicrobia bacterium]|nr:MAG: hypothetical protein DME59_02110 [Verrucomicrobiota bacterium]